MKWRCLDGVGGLESGRAEQYDENRRCLHAAKARKQQRGAPLSPVVLHSEWERWSPFMHARGQDKSNGVERKAQMSKSLRFSACRPPERCMMLNLRKHRGGCLGRNVWPYGASSLLQTHYYATVMKLKNTHDANGPPEWCSVRKKQRTIGFVNEVGNGDLGLVSVAEAVIL